jgi:hypothetical protein
MPDPTLFHGIAVVIDDEINDPAAGVKNIKKDIEDAGCHVLPFTGIPPDAGMANLKEVAFFVLDWKLNGAALREAAEGESVIVPAVLEEENEQNIVKFLRELKRIRFAPVFIFTDEPVESIKDKLRNYGDVYDESDVSHILVMDKTEVFTKGVFNVLSEWMKLAPSVFVLKSWERAYEKAKNELFKEFYVTSSVWPMVVWENFKADKVPPATLLRDLITRNLVSRMAPFDCDLEPFQEVFNKVKENADIYKGAVQRVLEGERFLAAEHLDKLSFEPGDVFAVDDGYRINIRPDCDCIPRGGDKLDRLDLYLLKGTEQTFADMEYNAEFGLIPEHDNEAIVFPVYGSKAISFKFRRLYWEKWRDIKEKRVGRLLPPFLTRLQQRYAAYMQRPGLSRLPTVAFPAAPVAPTGPAIATVPDEPVEIQHEVPATPEVSVVQGPPPAEPVPPPAEVQGVPAAAETAVPSEAPPPSSPPLETE